jgi:uncharacterized iron-regulated protein
MSKNIILAVIFLTFYNLSFAQEKPALSEKDLETNTYYFKIADHKLVGDGAKFLADELAKSQFVLLGEYHGSHQISVFTKAIIPILNDADFRNFGLEVGVLGTKLHFFTLSTTFFAKTDNVG